METKEEFQRRLDLLLADTWKMIEESQAYLISQGEVVEPDATKSTEYLTSKNMKRQ